MANGKGILAMTVDGRLTYCRADPDKRGMGKCNHIAHIKEGQEISDFIKENSKKGEIRPYRMTVAEKAKYDLINGRKQLADPDCEGGYIELENPVWSPANINEFSKICGLPQSRIRGVINGKVNLKDYGTGVEALNKYALDSYDYEATKDIYVIPYRYRQDLEDSKNPINALYNGVLTSRKNNQKNQEAFDRLLNNEKVYSKYNIQSLGVRGIPYQSLGGKFGGKKGLMRGLMSGFSVRDSAHLVITPCKEISPDEVGVPPHIVAELYQDDIYNYMKNHGSDAVKARDWIEKVKDPNYEHKDCDVDMLDKIMRETRSKCLLNRAPSLHNASLVGVYVRVNGAVETTTFGYKSRNFSKNTFNVSPSYCNGFNADMDGDMMSISRVTADDDVFNDSMTVNNILISHNPKNINESLLKPTKDSLFGLFNLLE